jgi:hypothetical protein
MACRILSKLEKKKLCRRDRISANEPYFYYTNKRPGQIHHALGVSWAYTWFMLSLNSWEKFHSFEREIKLYKILRPDGFVAIRNVFTNEFRFCFIELDIAESGNPFKKVELYNSLYSSEGYISSWWAPLTKRFPTIIIITTGSVNKINEKIKNENKNGLEFKVYSLDQIKEECFNARSSFKSVRA